MDEPAALSLFVEYANTYHQTTGLVLLLGGPLPVAGAPPPATHAVEQSEVPAHWALLDLVLVCHGRPLATSPRSIRHFPNFPSR